MNGTVLRQGNALVYTTPAAFDGARALVVLRSGMELSYSSVVTLRHTPGGLLVNGRPCRTVDPLSAGDRLEVRLPEPPPEPLPPYDGGQSARLVLADDWAAVYDKPPHMPTHPSHFHQSDTLANVFRARWPELAFRAVGRLDADTSGLILLALDAYGAFWFPPRVRKTYLAVACGTLPWEEGVIDAPLLPLDRSDGCHRVSPVGLPARTRVRVLAVRNGLSLVACGLETGRTHQIRAHLAHLGCPLAGDARYGEASFPPGAPAGSPEEPPSAGDSPCRPFSGRQALHCARLRFPEPDGRERDLFSRPPFLDALGFGDLPDEAIFINF